MMRALVLLLAGCGAATSDPGLRAELRVDGAQFATGAMSDGAGPPVVALHLSDPSLFPGAQHQPFLGELAPSATAVAIGLDGDVGHWIVLAGTPSIDAPTEPTFDVQLAIARDARLGARTISVHAVDESGRLGAGATLPITIAALAPPSGPLVVSLSWDTDADLDLHVIDPDGVEIWSGHPSGYRPPPPPALPDPAAAQMAPQLDVDSNAQCRIDGRNQENVVWSMAPAPGHYVVRVDAASLCGQVEANWRVTVLRDGNSIASASGADFDSDTRGTHGAGDGRTALSFDL
jgi:hypothetical protein